MPTKNTSSQNSLFVCIISYGDTRLLHKSLYTLSNLSLPITGIGVYVAHSSQTGQDIAAYKEVNGDLLTQHNVSFLDATTTPATVSDVIGGQAAAHIAFIHEGDCLDTTSLRNLITASQTSILAYPEVTVRYNTPTDLNKIFENPSFPSDPAAAKLATLSDQDFAHIFVTPITTQLGRLALPQVAPGHDRPLWRLALELLDHGYSLRRTAESVVFSPASKDEKKRWKTTPPPVHHFNSLAAIRDSATNAQLELTTEPVGIKQKIKDALKDNPRLSLLGQKTLHYTSLITASLPTVRRHPHNTLHASTDQWLITAAEEVHRYNSAAFISLSSQFPFTKEPLRPLSETGRLLYNSLESLRSDHYDYVLIVPWLIAGGADMFFVNYANAVAQLAPEKKVLVISTEPSRQSLEREHLKLSDSVDFLRLAELVKDSPEGKAELARALAAVIELANPQVLHIGLSAAGYHYVKQYKQALRHAGRRVILTGYNEIITNKRRVGYVHDIIPEIFDTADLITTDNQRIINLWRHEYGLPKDTFVIHHQPFSVPTMKRQRVDSFSAERPVRVLWAAHIRKEKNPLTYRDIAVTLQQNPLFEFTAYGAHDKVNFPLNPFTHPRTSALTYKGAYKDFLSDIHPEDYDVFVYTSLADGTPNILIEAGMTDLPIISSAVGGIPTLIQDRGTLIEDPTDTAAFVQQLEAFAKDPRPFYNKSRLFKKHLKATQTIESFHQEVKDMLNRVNFL